MMSRQATKVRLGVAFALAVGGILFPPFPLAAQERPPLSEELRRAFEDGGVAAAEARYQEILENEGDAYEFDTEATIVLGTEYAQSGNMEAAQAFFAIGSQMAVDAFQSSSTGVQLNAMMDSARLAEAERTGSTSAVVGETARSRPPDFGPPRDDLDRFFGLYRDPTTDRDLFVVNTCDGHLLFGPVWADVAPYQMRSEGDTRFVQGWMSEFQTVAYHLDFEVGPSGAATAVTHNVTDDDSSVRWARAGDLPEEWQECVTFGR